MGTTNQASAGGVGNGASIKNLGALPRAAGGELFWGLLSQLGSGAWAWVPRRQPKTGRVRVPVLNYLDLDCTSDLSHCV